MNSTLSIEAQGFGHRFRIKSGIKGGQGGSLEQGHPVRPIGDGFLSGGFQVVTSQDAQHLIGPCIRQLTGFPQKFHTERGEPASEVSR